MLRAVGARANATGLWLPSDWGQTWRAKRANAGQAIARVGIVGDSVSAGLWSSDLVNKAWSGLLRNSLQTLYGDGGSGFRSAGRSAPGFTTFGFAAGVINAYAAVPDNLIGTTGAWTYNTAGAGWGAGAGVLTVAAAGATATFKARGTKIDVYTLVGPGLGSLHVTIDGQAVADIATVAGAIGSQRTTYNVAAGTHTVVLTTVDATVVWVSGVSGENAAGVVVHNFSIPNAVSGWFSTTGNSSGGYGPSAAWSGGNKFPVDLVIYALGLNDANGGVGGDAWAKNVRRYVMQARNAGAADGSTDLLFVMPHLGNYDTANELYQDVVLRARALAEVYGAGFLNLWARGRNSYGYMTARGLMGQSAVPGAAGADVVHLSDAGHQWVHDQILPILTA